jgi:hypothetical protein
MQVLAEIQENVDQGMPHLARGSEVSGMVSIAEHVALAVTSAVDRTCKTYGEPRDSARERYLVDGFCDQMKVIGLYGKLHDAKPFARRFGESAAQRNEDRLFAKAR